MKKYKVISHIIETKTNSTKNSVLLDNACLDDAKIVLSKLYQNNRFNSDIKDIFFDGTKLSLFNIAINSYSNYSIIEMEE